MKIIEDHPEFWQRSSYIEKEPSLSNIWVQQRFLINKSKFLQYSEYVNKL